MQQQQNRRYGWPEFLGIVLSHAALSSAFFAIAGAVWAWALDIEMLTGAIVVGAIGGVVGALVGIAPANLVDENRRRDVSAGAHMMVIAPALALAALGGIVGVVRSVF